MGNFLGGPIHYWLLTGYLCFDDICLNYELFSMMNVFFTKGYWLSDLVTEQIIEMLSHLKSAALYIVKSISQRNSLKNSFNQYWCRKFNQIYSIVITNATLEYKQTYSLSITHWVRKYQVVFIDKLIIAGCFTILSHIVVVVVG